MKVAMGKLCKSKIWTPLLSAVVLSCLRVEARTGAETRIVTILSTPPTPTHLFTTFPSSALSSTQSTTSAQPQLPKKPLFVTTPPSTTTPSSGGRSKMYPPQDSPILTADSLIDGVPVRKGIVIDLKPSESAVPSSTTFDDEPAIITSDSLVMGGRPTIYKTAIVGASYSYAPSAIKKQVKKPKLEFLSDSLSTSGGGNLMGSASSSYASYSSPSSVSQSDLAHNNQIVRGTIKYGTAATSSPTIVVAAPSSQSYDSAPPSYYASPSNPYESSAYDYPSSSPSAHKSYPPPQPSYSYTKPGYASEGGYKPAAMYVYSSQFAPSASSGSSSYDRPASSYGYGVVPKYEKSYEKYESVPAKYAPTPLNDYSSYNRPAYKHPTYVTSSADAYPTQYGPAPGPYKSSQGADYGGGPPYGRIDYSVPVSHGSYSAAPQSQYSNAYPPSSYPSSESGYPAPSGYKSASYAVPTTSYGRAPKSYEPSEYEPLTYSPHYGQPSYGPEAPPYPNSYSSPVPTSGPAAAYPAPSPAHYAPSHSSYTPSSEYSSYPPSEGSYGSVRSYSPKALVYPSSGYSPSSYASPSHSHSHSPSPSYTYSSAPSQYEGASYPSGSYSPSSYSDPSPSYPRSHSAPSSSYIPAGYESHPSGHASTAYPSR